VIVELAAKTAVNLVAVMGVILAVAVVVMAHVLETAELHVALVAKTAVMAHVLDS
jgi:hypothetical protein